MDHSALLHSAIYAALQAGEEILKIYNTEFSVEVKPDNTPVTLADKAASKIIVALLEKTNIPVMSEEEEVLPFSERKNLSRIWIVDPLDGTKEFVKRNGEFTVNIALVENNLSVMGVIYSPVFKYLYFAVKHQGSYYINAHEVIEYLNSVNPSIESLLKKQQRLPLQKVPEIYTIVASRSHLSKEVSQRVALAKNNYGKVEIINTGSSIKFCWVAQGLAHEYPRFGTTMEWDTAAGQCIVEEAGGTVKVAESGEQLRYNREELKNPSFIVRSATAL